MDNKKTFGKRRNVLLLIIYFVAFQNSLFAQLEKFSIQQITTKEGLSSSEITCIAQDKSGIIWIGTKDGLNRYDGYTFKVYQNRANDPSSICDNNITSLLVDKKGNLWIGTESNGISIYNESTDSFESYNHDSFDLNSISFDYVTSITEDDNGKIWVGTLMGLNLFDIKKKNSKRLMRSVTITVTPDFLTKNAKILPVGLKNKLHRLSGKELEYKDLLKYLNIDADSIEVLKKFFKPADFENSGTAITSIANGSGNVLWLGLENGRILKLDINNLTTEAYKVPQANVNRILSLCSSSDKLWIGTMDEGVWTLDFSTSQFHKINREPESKFIKCIFEDSNNDIWIGDDEGLLKYDQQSKSLKRIYSYFKNKKLLSNDVSSILEDHQGNLWIASYQGGINHLKKGKAFNHFEFHDEKSAENGSKTVSAVAEDGEGNIWSGFYISGIDVIKVKSNEIKKFRHNPSDPSSIGFGTVHKIFKDSRNNIWVGTYEGGLQRFDKEKQSFVSVQYDGGKNNIKDVRDICEDKHGKIWFVVHGDGIKKYDPITQKITNYRADYSNWETSLSNDWVYSLFCDRLGRIWAGSVAGATVFDPSTDRYKTFRKLNSNISHDIVQVITEDTEGNIWIGTQNGLNLYQEKSNRFKVFTTEEGLSNNCIKGIQAAGKALWITTNFGLCNLQLPSFKIKNYFTSDGLNSTEFVQNAFSKCNSGVILFGGKNGLTIFNSSLLRENPFKPPVIITGFKLFNKTVAINNKENLILTKSITKTKAITLPYNQNVISFEYVGINYIMPENNSYAYKLEGFEDDWNYVGHKREATYTNLSPGEYIFKVKASNNDDVWNENATSIKLIINPPFWKTPIAMFLYAVFLIVILVVIRNEALQRLRIRSRIKMNEMKLNFFANISHEFRTPLTLIMGPLHQLNSYFEAGNNDQKELFSIMRKNGQRLLKLVNQLMNIYELDAGCMKLSVQQGDIIEFTQEIFNEFKSVACKRNISYEFISNVVKAVGFFDADKIEKILVNVISNAFKYTPDNGSIVLYFSLLKGDLLDLVPKHLIKSKSKDCQFVKLTVEDSGKGIPIKYKERIFERFFRIEDKESQPEGTGLGLYLAKQLSAIHNGDIVVSSSPEQGTEFVIWLPFDRKAYKEDDIKEESGKSFHSDLPEGDEIVEESDHSDDNLPLMLIVEDNEDVRRYLKLNFKSQFKILEAGDGVQGLQIAQKEIPDIIISDLMMPFMDGMQFCSKIKKDEKTNHIPIILLTARTEEKYQIKSLREAGADDYITKPFNMSILEAKVHNCLQYRESLKKKLQIEYKVRPMDIQIKSADDVFLEKLVKIVEDNMSDVNFDVTKICREIGMSQTNFYRKLQSILGISGAQFIKNVRLKRAAQLMEAKRFSVTEISYMVGFNDPKYFSKSFKKQYGMLPREYVGQERNQQLSPVKTANVTTLDN